MADTGRVKAKDDPRRRPQPGTFFLVGRYGTDGYRLHRDGWSAGETFLDSKGREYVVAPNGNLVRFFPK